MPKWLDEWLQEFLENDPKHVTQHGEGVPRFESDTPPYQPDVDNEPAKEADHPSIVDLLGQIADNTAKSFPQIKYRIMKFSIPSDYAFRLEGNYTRRSLNVYNNGPDQVYIVGYYGDVTEQGMPLPNDASLVLNTTDDVYFLSDGMSEIRLLEEYT